jgi:hypothetical protein
VSGGSSRNIRTCIGNVVNSNNLISKHKKKMCYSDNLAGSRTGTRSCVAIGTLLARSGIARPGRGRSLWENGTGWTRLSSPKCKRRFQLCCVARRHRAKAGAFAYACGRRSDVTWSPPVHHPGPRAGRLSPFTSHLSPPYLAEAVAGSSSISVTRLWAVFWMAETSAWESG